MALMERLDITDLRDDFVVCRTIGHSWDVNPAAEMSGELYKAAQAVLTLRCTRCTTERLDYIGKDMRVWHRFYRYPDKYRGVMGDQGRRPSLRAELIRRSLLIRRYEENQPNRTRRTRNARSHN